MSFRPIIGIPRLTQDWGTEQHERETHWTSLFYDLMIVAALNAIAEPFEEFEETVEEGQFLQQLTSIKYLWLNALLQFSSVLNSWNALCYYTSLFEDESVIGHLSFYVHCFGLAATTAGCVGELEENYKVLGTGIILAKIGLLVLFLRPIIHVERARTLCIYRCVPYLMNIMLMLYGLLAFGNEENGDFAKFRIVLIIGTIWDWLSVVAVPVLLKKEQRVPLHILSMAGRVKEVTMVIFGEAVFAIILQPYTGARPQTHFYVTLGTTLWLIYGIALQEFHISPSEDDHAMRRSIFFGISWWFTQIVKQIFLLGTSIGIKRAHLLTFKAPLEPVDTDTRNLIVWGMSMTMLSIVLIRSYSLGWGRHPSPQDPPPIYRLKVAWWAIMLLSSILPQIVDKTIVEAFPQPLPMLIAFGGMMIMIIMFEAAISNLLARRVIELMVAEQSSEGTDLDERTLEQRVDERAYLKHFSSHALDVEGSNEHAETSFLLPHAPAIQQKPNN
eukprot:CAMPEP_0195305080 /NCGR_PEP_ID=MMETSP0707-20130614/35629_1 /TAXON_ID=33640 /ORGANISM="Asterionellopsis glacialis, Strain CCMP134" /LENGTH=499 /DNA_ID=CAMNT_0040369097 /DNA_START=73 /DNA_END=1572 /DNA_ORIENTATION=-